MKKVLAAMTLLGSMAVAGCGGSGEDPPDARPTTSSSSSTTTPKASTSQPAKTTAAGDAALQAALAKFEDDNAIPTSAWFKHVTTKELKFGSSLWVHTDYAASGPSESVASGICGSYAQYSLVDPKVTTVFVRAADGQQLAKCGPGA